MYNSDPAVIVIHSISLPPDYDPEFSMGDHMFRDLALSRDIMEEFHNKPIGQGSAEKLNVMVLQRSFWPFSARTTDDILLPYDVRSVTFLVSPNDHNTILDARRLDEVHYVL